MQDVPESNDSCLIITLKVECMQFVAVSYSCISLSACEKITCPYCWHVQESCLSVSIFEKELLSWWQMKRYFSRHGNQRSVHYKLYPDVVIVHPEPRFTTAMNAEQWREACILALLAYCNHGPCCAATTFADLKSLQALPPDALEALMHDFATLGPEERRQRRMASCPPHLRNKYRLGDLRRRRLEERKLSRPVVTASLPKVKFVFANEKEDWTVKPTGNMDESEFKDAKHAWRAADAEEREIAEEADKDIQPDEPERTSIHERMKTQLLKFRVETSQLHNATLAAGLAVPSRPSVLSYFAALNLEFGDSKAGFLPQNLYSHTKKILKDVLDTLFSGNSHGSDPNFSSKPPKGNKTQPTKGELAERLAARLGEVVDAGRAVQLSEDEGSCDHSSDIGGEDNPSLGHRGRKRQKAARPIELPGELPHDAVITPEQAESSLNRNAATEWDEDMLEQIDVDQRAEEEELTGRVMHPSCADYSCLSWCPDPTDILHSSDAVSATDVNWHPPLCLRKLGRADFAFVDLSNGADSACDAVKVRTVLERGIRDLEVRCHQEIHNPNAVADLQRDAGRLDPTQRLVYEVLESWAQKQLSWRRRNLYDDLISPPFLRLLLLGTAGTGKTHTAKVAIRKVRTIFGRYNSVLTLAFSGVAAANLGGGAQTIDSVFHTNAENAVQDLVGDKLDRLVAQLRHVELLLIDEISTVGAAQLEIINRRLQQVSRVVHREQFGTHPPDNFGTFGSCGVVLMGDFAQLPPVLASSLLFGAPIVERPTSGMRTLALAGRQAFAGFSQAIRLRRIHRQKGADAFKESTMRLRDAAITTDDYDLWKTHEVASINQETSVCDWEGGETLLATGLTLVADNRQAGAINGKRLAATAPLSQFCPDRVAATQTIVRCEAKHSHEKGDLRKSDDFRNVRKALHIRVGAKVTLCLNQIWDVPTVQLGLMNGARGTIVAILYAAPGDARADGVEIAGTGYHPKAY